MYQVSVEDVFFLYSKHGDVEDKQLSMSLKPTDKACFCVGYAKKTQTKFISSGSVMKLQLNGEQHEEREHFHYLRFIY